MTTPRQELADQIRADQPDYVVCSYPKTPANVTKGHPFVDVWVTSITPIQDDARLAYELEVHCYASSTEGDAAEAEAEDVRDEVLLSIQRLTNYAWTRAERVNFGDQGEYVGYKITVVGGSPVNVYAQKIREES